MKYTPSTNLVLGIQKRVLFWSLGPAILASLIAIVVAFGAQSRPVFSAVVGICSSILCAIVAFVSINHRIKRSRQQLQRLDWHVCHWCEYNMSATGDSHECPECGHEWSPELLRNDFEAYASSLQMQGISVRSVSVSTNNRSCQAHARQCKAEVYMPYRSATVMHLKKRVDRLQATAFVAAWFAIACVMRRSGTSLDVILAYFVPILVLAGLASSTIVALYVAVCRRRIARRLESNAALTCLEQIAALTETGEAASRAAVRSNQMIRVELDHFCRAGNASYWI